MSLVGVLADQRKGPAVIGLAISGLMVVVFFVIPFLLSCFF